MARKLDEATKDYLKRKNRLEIPGFVLQFIGISVLVTGIMLKLESLIKIGTTLIGTGFILIAVAETIYQKMFKK